MKRYKENIILIILLIGLSFYLFLHKTDKIHYKLPDIPEVTAKDITKLEIVALNSSLILEQKSGRWYIKPEGYPADNNKVSRMLDCIQDIKVTALVSQLKNYNLYDLNDEKKITVKAWNGTMLKRFFEVGKTASSYHHTFIILAKNGQVYQAEGDLRSRFDLTIDELRDKLILSFEKKEIIAINIEKGGAKVALELKKVASALKPRQMEGIKTGVEHNKQALAEVWQAGDGKKCVQSKIDILLKKLSNLKCKKFITIENKDNFTEPLFTIDLKGTKAYRLSIFPRSGEEAADYPCTSSGTEYPFLLGKYQAENIMIHPEEIIEKEQADLL